MMINNFPLTLPRAKCTKYICRHPREGGGLVRRALWVPAYAGMTRLEEMR